MVVALRANGRGGPLAYARVLSEDLLGLCIRSWMHNQPAVVTPQPARDLTRPSSRPILGGT